jgi:Caenorhabditis protein of unknown function, DUF268
MTTPTSPARLLARCARVFGLEPRELLHSLPEIPAFAKNLVEYNRRNNRPAFKPSLRHINPILSDHKAQAGESGQYFHQDLWAARKIFSRRPESHVDVGSRLDGFVAHLLVFMPVTFVDIRAIDDPVAGLTFVRDDATTLAGFENDSLPSISSLHAAEHFGLGRYGDPIDPDACFRFMSALARVLQPGGRLYFSVPIGRERLEFNAHRVFGVETTLDSFAGLSLCSLSTIDDNGRLHEDVDPACVPRFELGCGLFEFTK